MNPAVAALLFGATFIALSPIFVRLSDVGPIASAFWRVALAVPVLWAVYFAARKQGDARPGNDRSLFAAGIAFAGDLAFWHLSIQYTSVANATLLANLASIFVTLAAWVLWKQRPRALFLGGLAAALAGVALLVHSNAVNARSSIAGDGMGVVTAMFYAWYLIAVKGARDRGAPTIEVMALTTTVTAVVLFPIALASGTPLLPQGAHGWAVLIGLALVSHAAGQGLIAYALAHLPAAFSSVSLLLQPVMAAVFAWALLSEPLVALQMVGGAVVLAGIYLARRGSA